jgi:hypothetical protein
MSFCDLQQPDTLPRLARCQRLPFSALPSEKEEEVHSFRKQGDLPFVLRYRRIRTPNSRPERSS